MLKKLMSKNKFSLMFLFLLLSMALTSIGFCSWSIYKEFGVYSKNVVDPVCYIKRSDGNVEYYRIEDALDDAKSGEEIYCYVGKNPTITRDCEIKRGVSLIIPFSDTASYGQRSFDGSAVFGDDASKKENLKNTVTIAKNVTMQVNGGKIMVGGQLGTKGAGLSGQTSGAFSQILMDQNSKILFDSSSSNLLDLYGYIKETTKNNGSYIEMKAGETKMPFVVYDFRGGANTVGVYNHGASPFSVFDMPNVTPTIKFEYNAKITGYADLYAGNKHNLTTIKILDKSKALMNFSTSNSYLIAKRQQANPLYNSSKSYTDGTYTRLDFYNGLNSGNLEMKVQGTTVTTTSVLFPLSFKFHVYLHSGNYNLVTKMKIMTGAKLVVDDNSTLIANKDLIVYKEFNDQSKISPLYPAKDEGEFIIKGDATINSAFGGKIQTSNDKKNDANLNVNTSTLSVTSKEAYNTDSIGAFFGKVEGKYPVTETGKINLNTNGNTSINNLEKTIYYSLYTDNFFIKATNLGEYKMIFHLNGGTIDGSTNDIEQTYKIAKESTTIRGISLADPVKKYYQFDGWFIDDTKPAIGQTVYKGDTLHLYAHYSFANYHINYMVVYDDEEGKLFDTSSFKDTFNYKELDLALETPVDPEYHFYGWYVNNDLTNTIDKITQEMGYQDINLYGVFSKSVVCKVTFDANGHPDYFNNLESFNILTSDPKNVKLPTSQYDDDDPTKEYYLIGWEDENGKLFNKETYAFKNETLLLKAKWGNKFTLKYVDRNSQQIGNIEYYKSGSSAFIKGSSEIGEENAVVEDVDPKKYKIVYTISSWTDMNNNVVNFYDNYVINKDTVLKAKYSTKNYIYLSISNESWSLGKYQVVNSAILNGSIDILSDGAYVCNTDSIKFNIEGSNYRHRNLDIQFGKASKINLKQFEKKDVKQDFVLNFNDSSYGFGEYFNNPSKYNPIQLSATLSW